MLEPLTFVLVGSVEINAQTNSCHERAALIAPSAMAVPQYAVTGRTEF